jgi:ankyrin repeat protein
LAIKKNHFEVVKNLLSNNNIDVNILTPKGGALHLASHLGKIQILSLLLQKKADPELKLPNG